MKRRIDANGDIVISGMESQQDDDMMSDDDGSSVTDSNVSDDGETGGGYGATATADDQMLDSSGAPTMSSLDYRMKELQSNRFDLKSAITDAKTSVAREALQKALDDVLAELNGVVAQRDAMMQMEDDRPVMRREPMMEKRGGARAAMKPAPRAAAARGRRGMAASPQPRPRDPRTGRYLPASRKTSATSPIRPRPAVTVRSPAVATRSRGFLW